jgi:hypothetical protein
MTDEHTEGDEHTERDEHAEDKAVAAPLTNEERLRALTSDRKPKSRGKGAPVPGDAQHRPGDVVDAVRERSNMDSGRDTPF